MPKKLDSRIFTKWIGLSDFKQLFCLILWARVNFSDQNLFVVRRCCRCCSWRKPFTFSSSSPEPQGQFQLMRIQVCSNEGPHPFPREDNYKIAKMHWLKLRILFSRTTGPISTKLCTMPPWVMVQMKGHTLFEGEIIMK